MKKYKDIGIYDFSDYAEEITGDSLFKINGGSTSCSNEAPSSPSAPPASPAPKETAPAQTTTTTTTTTPAPSPAQTTTPTPSGPTGPSGSDVPENKQKNETSWSYNPNEPDSDKRYNAKDYNGKHLMTIRYEDKENFDDFAGYYSVIGQYGSAGTTVYDGIGLTDKDGNIIHVLKDEGSIQKYAEYLNPSDGNIYSWYNKKDGEMLTESEAKIQKGIGIAEMVSGPVFAIGACEATFGASVATGSYIMADGAVVYSSANNYMKQTPGSFYTKLITPGVTDIPNPSDVIPKWR